MLHYHPDHRSLSLAPLGAGDLIDRAVRFYRRNFSTFVLIAAPPVIVGTVISVGWSLLARQMFVSGTEGDGLELTLFYIFIWLGSMVIWFAQTVATLSIMGGASRNFVRHLLFGERITFRDTYRNARERIGGLLAASSFIAVVIGVIGFVIFYMGLTVAVLLGIFAAAALQYVPVVNLVVPLVLGGAVMFGTVWIFFLVASRFAYVPQVMMVEGLGVFPAIARSASLAGKSVKRLAALFIFTTIATYSALAILYVPLGWYAWLQGVDVFGLEGNLSPAWYDIASQLTWQASLILLSPVWMVGLCLLYVDERVRREGYDIELLAARRLGDIPAVPNAYANPLQPALATAAESTSADPPSRSKFTTLGLK